MKIKKILFIFLILILVGCASYLIYYGFKVSELNKPNNVYGRVIDEIDSKIFNYIDFDEKYKFYNNFNINGKVKYELDSELYKSDLSNSLYLVKLNRINNLNKMDSTFSLDVDSKKNKLLFSTSNKIGEEVLLDSNYYVEDSTKYIYLSNVINKYINDGNFNYFETIGSDSNNLDNYNYLHEFIINSLKNNLKEEYFNKTLINTSIGGNNTDTYQLSIVIDDNIIHKILEGILSDLKNDNRCNTIISSFYSDFSKYKIDRKHKFLENDESYTINIYVSKFLIKPLKYEVKYINKEHKKDFVIENFNKGKAYYLEDSEVKYSIDYNLENLKFDLKFFNSLNKGVGNITYINNKGEYNLDVDLVINNSNYVYNFVSKIDKFKKNKSYIRTSYLDFSVLNNNIIKISGKVNSELEFNNSSKIDVEIGDVVLKSALSEEESTKYDESYNNFKSRLER